MQDKEQNIDVDLVAIVTKLSSELELLKNDIQHLFHVLDQKEEPFDDSIYKDRDGLYNFQVFKRGRIKDEDGDD